MRKKFLAITLTLTMAVSMMAGCGSSQKDYENDLELLEELYTDFEYPDFDITEEEKVTAMFKDMKEDIADMKFSTKEGKAIQTIQVDAFSYYEDLFDKILDAYNNEDFDKMSELLEELDEQIEDMEKDMEDAVEDFIDAAEEAGVDEDDLEDFE